MLLRYESNQCATAANEKRGARSKRKKERGVGSGVGITQTSVAYKQEPKAKIE